jgi:hypothetical protein
MFRSPMDPAVPDARQRDYWTTFSDCAPRVWSVGIARVARLRPAGMRHIPAGTGYFEVIAVTRRNRPL